MTDLSDKKIKEMRKDVQETQKIMEDNIEKLISRAELLERLDETTKDLRGHTQEFALKSSELKTSLQTRHYIYKGIMLFGAAGTLYGLLNGYGLGGCVAVGLFGSMVGGAVGYYAGTIKGFVNRLVFAYQLQDSPLKAMKNKLSNVFHNKLKQTPTGVKQEITDKQTSHAPIEEPQEPLEISKTLTQWFETKKQEKQQKQQKELAQQAPSKKTRNSLHTD